MAAVKLSAKGVGSVVKIKVNGTLRNFIVVHQGKPSSIYDASCDGTWLLMEDIYETRQWHSSNVNDYANSTIHSYLNSTFLNLIDANIRAQIKQAKIPYRPGSGTSQSVNSGANGLSAKIFLLSDREVGYTQSNVNQYIVNDGAKLSYFQDGNGTTEKIAKLNGSATLWWLRSPCTYDSTYAWLVLSDGDANNGGCTYAGGVRPALILPSTLLVSDDGSVNTNTAPSTPGSITVPGSINGGDSITVSWGASSDAENNLEGYELERSVNGGSSWSNVYKGNARSTTNTVPFGTESVMYRVRAYDSQGLYSSYKTSNQVTVVNNNAPSAPASITVPVTVLGGAALTVTWGAASDSDGNLSGYALERQVDGGAWSEINRGTALSFNDTITKGWASVAYRVRAYDTAGAYSGYATSPARTVNNNTAPAITSSATNGSDLGVKNGGFTVSYSVSDADNDAVTVTETIDGAKKREFSATLGGSNSFAVTGETFMKLLNGKHTLSITANDGQATASHSVTFTKEVTGASITLDEPMTADAPITICVLSVIGFVPADAHFTVEVTNNALDDAPVWEDCTSEVKTGANHIFTNKTASKGAAFNFRITAERGASGEGGYITSVQGGFQ
ncbi:fibronectin type III domain-containing protein [Clostridiaceae bacterium]|nr:fibronectin type III domain-containing protein [Clostridiaceae bacterium]